MSLRFLSIALALGLAACAEPASSYRPLAGDFGYAEHRVDQNTWRVGFAGNGGTPRESVEIYALYRAAEVTIAEGRERFAVLESEVETTQTSWDLELLPFTLQHESSYGFQKATGIPVPSLRPPTTRTIAWATIRTLPGEVPEDAPVHDARQVIEIYGAGF